MANVKTKTPRRKKEIDWSLSRSGVDNDKKVVISSGNGLGIPAKTNSVKYMDASHFEALEILNVTRLPSDNA